MFTDLYNKVSRACCCITVFSGDERISEGTGFSCSPDGLVLTAAHVVTGCWPLRSKDYEDVNQRIFCKFPGMPVFEYKVLSRHIEIDFPNVFKNRIQLDISLLTPKEKYSNPISHLMPCLDPPQLGQQVFIAGYSEELKLPFNLDEILSRDVRGANEFLEAMSKGYMADMTGPLIKCGHVGNIRRIIGENTTQAEKIECDVMYIDNSMHYGASGGPVFNEDGEAVGVLSERAITTVNDSNDRNISIPSGCTIAISLTPLNYLLSKLGKRSE